MKRGRASQTASMVVMLRALADAGVTGVRGFADPTARTFLTGFWKRAFERAAQQGRAGKLATAAREGAELLALRTLEIDDRVRARVAGGARQLVLLGAGFDGRAFRMPELADADVFEVDYPATQAAKRELAAPLRPRARSLTFVAVDFERDEPGAALQAAGHRAAEPTVWVWEGVVMYLSDAALRATLKVIAGRSAPGSAAIIQYNTPGPDLLFKRLLLLLWGEPQIGLRTPEAMARELGRAGFHAADDSGIAAWAERHGATVAHRAPESRKARIVTAEVSGA